MIPSFMSFSKKAWEILLHNVEMLNDLNKIFLGTSSSAVHKKDQNHEEPEKNNQLDLSNNQLAILQRISEHFLLRKQEIQTYVPEIGEELQKLFGESSTNWEWFPLVETHEKLLEEIHSHPEEFELVYTPEKSPGEEWEYRLVNFGIRSKDNHSVIRRALLDVYVLRNEKEAEDYLDELSKI